MKITVKCSACSRVMEVEADDSADAQIIDTLKRVTRCGVCVGPFSKRRTTQTFRPTPKREYRQPHND